MFDLCLKHRDYEVDLESRLGKTQVVTPIAPLSQQFMASEYASPPEEKDGSTTSILRDCGEIISTLPRMKAWGCESGDTDYCQYQGFWYSPELLEGLILAQQSFRARDTDIFLATYPKCGTTWVKALMSAIQIRPCYSSSQSQHPLLTKNPHDCVPFLELLFCKDNSLAYLESPSSPRLLSTHSSYSSLPDSILNNPGTRIVYVARNPKDVLVSLWKFVPKVNKKFGQLLPQFSNEEAFELFCKGESVVGPFWDHILGYWEASMENPSKLLFLKYEDLKKDTENCVKKLAEFMHYPFSLEEERQGVVQQVINFCSFENLSNLEVNKSGTQNVTSKKVVDNSLFFRKGQVGDSSNYLTPDMLKHLDKITEHKFGSAGLKF